MRRHTTPDCAFGFTSYKDLQTRYDFNGQMRNKHFFIVIYHSSLVKAAVNAERVCKLHNGVKKGINFFFFQRPKVDQVRNEYSPQLSKLLYNCKLKNKIYQMSLILAVSISLDSTFKVCFCDKLLRIYCRAQMPRWLATRALVYT
jgi:hypothetical protein